MKRNAMPALLFYSLFFPTLFAAEVSSQTKMNIAVSDLIGQGVDQASAAIISDRLRTELFNAGAFKVLERQSMQDILKEQGFQQSGCTSDQCLVEIGQVLGVSQIISGTVGKLGGMFTLNIRMIDVKTAEIVYTTSIDCRCAIEDVLTNSVPSIAGKIAASVGKPITAAPKAPPVSQPPPTGSLRIQTAPPGAKIFVDKADRGLTPFTKDTVSAGSHSIAIQLDGYEGLDTGISVSSGEMVNKTFNLDRTKVWKDSVESARRSAEAVKNTGKPRKKHSVAPKIVFGLLAAGSGVAGVVFNNLEQGKINHDGELKQEYVASGYSNSSDYQGQLNTNAQSAKKFDTIRNVCFIAVGAFVAGFAISFAF
jgi:TolB-like protein